MKSVDKGAALLDERRPGWHWRVDPDRINLESAYDCVLGQEYGKFSLGAWHLDLDMKLIDIMEYGFAKFSPWRGTKGFTVRAWRRAIEARRDADLKATVPIGDDVEIIEVPAPEKAPVKEVVPEEEKVEVPA